MASLNLGIVRYRLMGQKHGINAMREDLRSLEEDIEGLEDIISDDDIDIATLEEVDKELDRIAENINSGFSDDIKQYFTI